MPTAVTDAASHRQEKIANAARVIGPSTIRQKVFDAICAGKKLIKNVEDIQKKTDLSYMQILKAAVVFINEEIVTKTKVDGRIAYQRNLFYSKNKRQILRLAASKDRLEKYPTSYTPKPIASVRGVVRIIVPARYVQARRIAVDEIDSFRRVKSVPHSGLAGPQDERMVKKGLQRILREPGIFNDWGGETDDLFSTRLRIGGRRMAVAFGLKGKATKGKLTPRKMGKNADQIQRLFRSPADVFIVQYWNNIDSSILEQMQNFAKAKSVSEGKLIYYGVIDGQDTVRLIKAYPKEFGSGR